MLFFSAPSKDLVEAFAKADPYVTGGLVTEWKVRAWTTVIGEGAAQPPAARAVTPGNPRPVVTSPASRLGKTIVDGLVHFYAPCALFIHGWIQFHAHRPSPRGASHRHRPPAAPLSGAPPAGARAPVEARRPRGHAVLDQPRPARARRAQGQRRLRAARQRRSFRRARRTSFPRSRRSCAKCAPPVRRSPW